MSVYRVVGRIVGSVLMVLALPVGVANAQAGPVVKAIETVTRVSAHGLLKSVANARELPGGRILAVDLIGRRTVILDSALTTAEPVGDRTAGQGIPEFLGGGIPFSGDSTLLVNAEAMALVVVDGRGTVARVMGLPRPQDGRQMYGGPFGMPGIDPQGRLVYRAATADRMTEGTPKGPGQIQGMDTAALVRVNLVTRVLDTVTFIRISEQRLRLSTSAEGRMSLTVGMDALPQSDEWGVLPDGTVAVVRGRDYHVDWFTPDGRHAAGPKIPFAWVRLADEDKGRVRDSVMAVEQGKMDAAFEKTGSSARSAVRLAIAPVDSMPDYRPPFGTNDPRSSAVRVDPRGRLWIRTNVVDHGCPIYDVVDRSGTLVGRWTLPMGRSLAGFGATSLLMAVLDGESALVEIASLP